MKSNNSNNFEPIYLQDAKRHIEWLYERIKKISEEDKKEVYIKKTSIFSGFWTFLKKVF